MEWSRFSKRGDEVVFRVRGMEVHRERSGEGWGVGGRLEREESGG